MLHVVERFAAAVRALVGDGPVKQRLSQAYSEHLADLQETDLPVGLRDGFGDLHHAVSRVAPVGSESRVHANVRKMSAAEASAHAAAIVKLYVDLMSQGERVEPLKVVTSAKPPPRYLARGS